MLKLLDAYFFFPSEQQLIISLKAARLYTPKQKKYYFGDRCSGLSRIPEKNFVSAK